MEKEKKLLISYTMNKLIKRDFFLHTRFFLFPPSHHSPLEIKNMSEKKKSTPKNVRVHRYTTTKKRGRGDREKGRRMSRQWCASQAPSCLPKYPARVPCEAARTPLRARAAIISEGDGKLKWHTNFSKTSSEKSTPLPSWQTPPN